MEESPPIKGDDRKRESSGKKGEERYPSSEGKEERYPSREEKV